MSKINALRLINLNYNNNSIRINDEVFHFNGESTLLSLRNGGGKSVLVQMMMAPFVHKRYRDAKDRPFESYFTSNKPTFIMVEWCLDGGAGYVLTGMMVRKNQEQSEERAEELEIVNFISEYQAPCIQDIYHLPVVEKTKKEINLKGFAACRQLFESYRKDRAMEFYSYDMNQPAQSRQYFDKCREYQINNKEWETIIKKVNLKESGLSELFADCRDEKGLVEKWLLDAVESKLNKDKNRMKEFESIVTKYVAQYKDNRSKIERRDTIRLFHQEAAVILEQAKQYEAASARVADHENRIVRFMEELERLASITQKEREQVHEQMEAVREEIRRIGYERISFAIQEQKEQQSYHVRVRDMIGLERDGLEHERGELTRKKRLLECARWRDEADESHKEYLLAKERLEILKKRQEDLEPERNRLGGRLRAWYEDIWRQLQGTLADNERQLQEKTEKLGSQKDKEIDYQKQIVAAGEKSGELKSKIAAYDGEEERFNRRYEENFQRNILGEYEPAALELKLDACKQEREGVFRELVGLKRRIGESEEQIRTLRRAAEDTRRDADRAISEKAETERELNRLESELTQRRTILKYLELPEDAVFDTERVLSCSARKLKEISQAKRKDEKELDELEKVYERLTQGKVLELPPEFEEMLDQIGVQFVYGMDWLKKNGNAAEKNQEMVRRNPFIPYALILSGQELQKLIKYGEHVYTSSPIPIIRRETLETMGQESRSGLVSMEPLSFYVLFNDNLLDEEKLAKLILRKKEEIVRKQGIIQQKALEYEEYFEKQEKIRNQTVTRERYEGLRQKVAQLEESGRKLLRAFDEQKEQVSKEEEHGRELREAVGKAELTYAYLGQKTEDLQILADWYGQYITDREALSRLKRQVEDLSESIERSRRQQERLSQQMASLRETSYLLKLELKKTESEKSLYDNFEEMVSEDEGKVTQEEVSGLESRFKAVTEKISGEQKDLEARLVKTKRQYEKNREEFDHLTGKYGFTPKEYGEVRYSRGTLDRTEDRLRQKEKEQKVKDAAWNEEDKTIALLRQKLDDLCEAMNKKFGEEEPLARSEITQLDFDVREQKAAQMLSEKNKKAASLEQTQRGYEENLTALTEYRGLTPGAEIVWNIDFASMSYRELGNYKGEMVRDYSESQRLCRKEKDSVTSTLNKTVRLPAFEEEFFKKPLEALLQLTDNASEMMLQLTTTLASYDSLMEKLEVDISMIEKERDKIVEILEDYVQDVHQNLGRIDKNSTIAIRERQVKMLKIGLPNWDENREVYHLRLQDYMAKLTEHSIRILEQNENAAEYLGSKVTTRSLYDTVVGIGNVEIRLYKIEERKELPITWAEVAKNSGGEGFLSAFVILNSLLYYMRKDESDIFADRTEGKVLVMDNPFAQTNASHLLKPLMDMAKKTDTQLICLSGLGGESIYNRFDNIYVLNLVASKLRSGMQYLRADHIRGLEPEEMVLSRIEVTRQMELEF